METKTQTKDRLRKTVKLLEKLNEEVEDCLSEGKPLSATAYRQLQTLSGSDNFDTQLAALEALSEQAETELIEVWTGLARTNYHDFYEFMARNDGDEGEGYIMSPHQRLIGDLLMSSASKETMRFMLSMPPGHCKSTHSSHHFPAYWLGKFPRKIFLQAGHSQDFVAKELGAKARSIVESDDYKLVFPDIKIRSDARAMDYWGLSNKKGKYIAKGVGQGISGFRGHYGMVDDPYKSREDAESPTVREKVHKWYVDDFCTRLMPNTPIGIIMTRWHSDDLCGRLTDLEVTAENAALEKLQKEIVAKDQELQGNKRKFAFEIINLPAVCEEENDPLGRAVGEVLWSEVYDLEALEVLKAPMTDASWNSLYQGTPIDITGGAVLLDWFKRYEHPPTKSNVAKGIVGTVRRITVSVDAANVKKERADYTVIGVWAEDMLKNHYLLDVARKKMEFTELCTEIDRVCKRYEADALLVEAKGNGLAYCQLKANGGAPAPLIPIEVGTNSKEFRFDEVTPMFEAGQVYLPISASVSWLAPYTKEIVSFPHGTHDDQVDMTSQYLKWARVKARRGTKKATGAGYGK